MWGLKLRELHKYGTDITAMAQMGKLSPVIGREEELQLLIGALMKKRNSNACLVGGAGVGKTAVVEALALKIARNSVPDELKGKKVISIGMGRIVDGAMNSDEIEKRVKKLLDEVREKEGDVILFLDDVHDFIKEYGVAKLLKFTLSRDDFKCICATRGEEYRRYVESDGVLKHMFEIVQVCEPSREESIEILKGMIDKYEAHHRVTYTPQALVSAVDLSKHYISELFLPGKAINLIDKVGARVRALGRFYLITKVEIEYVVAKSAEVRSFTKEEAASLLRLEDSLKSSIIGQDKAVAAVCGSIRRSRVEMRDGTKPIGCFMFVGPTGVGKTEMAKVLAKEYFGSKAAVVRLDTRKFMGIHTVSRLVNQMVDEVRRKPHCLVLFDEIEKAHEEALNVVLQIINGGRLSDSEGKAVEFKDTIMVVISNAEAHSYKAEVINGFDQFVVFQPLEKEDIEKILKITIERFGARVLARNKARVEFSERLKEWLLMVGYNKRYGARALKRAFASSVETKWADLILWGRVAEGDLIKLDVTLNGEVECYKINQTRNAQQVTATKDSGYYPHIFCESKVFDRFFHYSDSDFDLLMTKTKTVKDANGEDHTKTTIGGVDVELVRPLLHKYSLQHPLRKDFQGWFVEGVEADVVLRIVKSFL